MLYLLSQFLRGGGSRKENLALRENAGRNKLTQSRAVGVDLDELGKEPSLEIMFFGCDERHSLVEYYLGLGVGKYGIGLLSVDADRGYGHRNLEFVKPFQHIVMAHSLACVFFQTYDG